MPTSTGMENTRINVKILGRFHNDGSVPPPPFFPPLEAAFPPPPITRASLMKGKDTRPLLLLFLLLVVLDRTMGRSLPTGRGKGEVGEEEEEETKPSRLPLRRDKRKADKVWKAYGRR